MRLTKDRPKRTGWAFYIGAESNWRRHLVLVMPKLRAKRTAARKRIAGGERVAFCETDRRDNVMRLDRLEGLWADARPYVRLKRRWRGL